MKIVLELTREQAEMLDYALESCEKITKGVLRNYNSIPDKAPIDEEEIGKLTKYKFDFQELRDLLSKATSQAFIA